MRASCTMTASGSVGSNVMVGMVVVTVSTAAATSGFTRTARTSRARVRSYGSSTPVPCGRNDERRP